MILSCSKGDFHEINEMRISNDIRLFSDESTTSCYSWPWCFSTSCCQKILCPEAWLIASCLEVQVIYHILIYFYHFLSIRPCCVSMPGMYIQQLCVCSKLSTCWCQKEHHSFEPPGLPGDVNGCEWRLNATTTKYHRNEETERTSSDNQAHWAQLFLVGGIPIPPKNMN